ncbi:hypothetical protein, partial [Acinetobacter soli]|uniref:hypothetical protein n=1 Tax=Acinetobacter soli TaxID=487316 RepID=UPI001BC87832
LILFVKSKSKSIGNVFASLILFEKQKLQSSHPSGCSVNLSMTQKKACNQGKSAGEIFMMLNRS